MGLASRSVSHSEKSVRTEHFVMVWKLLKKKLFLDAIHHPENQ